MEMMMSMVLVCFFFYSVAPVISNEFNHCYKAGNDVPLYVNKVGHNPSETYRHFDLLYCSSAPVNEKKEAPGEVLNGDQLVSAPYKLELLSNKDSVVSCKKKLSREEAAKFRDVISKDYYFQMYYDDLPIFAFMGKIDMDTYANPSTYKYYLYNHLQVIEINLRVDPYSLVDVTKDKEVEVDFRYTVEWKGIEVTFEKRMEKYTKGSCDASWITIGSRPLICVS